MEPSLFQILGLRNGGFQASPHSPHRRAEHLRNQDGLASCNNDMLVSSALGLFLATTPEREETNIQNITDRHKIIINALLNLLVSLKSVIPCFGDSSC